ncbi:arylamine N-acetyltransferase, pineal gland isozyme NAT-3-like [Stegostoma tigrinum]|uniref:arylamine N-acetyltransferase, pineal gland isozyme NAT-3-like n=1 Tax=Stegostoma tigrinum TaxID=3053191 RepID=UPI002870AEDC|nr:arylamine N-acetyltransferase, pineal gland isozyme NAT-3-like [Stegostoma tigrinum]XP_059509171.1 arylamine N-acetyltransferase, pineal gland isozyme NAT-3-like [Stegostoma tigrinum]XP_059509172.1 arylamine N-acetyltransferase, pineal gland isozyme NAT-3-like [Stegostoma tigrinum]XP_059509173.1 arylamine N-acetyltransferase, pineal gland isozyme NAT-3-like [Stegostoma tigrinum]XP_059509175.1 arylamine N-acetyltransferase, pineal gland isozyme NAT-3-like [Stegostoma tigrinum]
MKLSEYFARIGYTGPCNKADLETLSKLVENHVTSIPYENLNPHCGETIEVNVEAVFDKMVRKQRGGCCVEHNGLFWWVLKEMGYNVMFTAARLYKPAKDCYESYPSHCILIVTIDSKSYVADVGFVSSYQLRQPLELVSGKEQSQLPGTFRLTEENNIWYMDKAIRKLHIEGQSSNSEFLQNQPAYEKLFCFALKPYKIEDFQDKLTYLITTPGAMFKELSYVCYQTQNGIKILKGTTYIEKMFNGKDGTDVRTSKSLTEEELQHVLRETFNLMLDKKITPVNNFTHFLIE